MPFINKDDLHLHAQWTNQCTPTRSERLCPLQKHSVLMGMNQTIIQLRRSHVPESGWVRANV